MSRDNHPARKLFPLPEAREQLGGISHATAYRWERKGKLKLVRIGGRTFVSGDEIARLCRGDEAAKAA